MHLYPIVTRSTIAATSRGSGKTVPHSLKGMYTRLVSSLGGS
jgi:hypothetical protein